MLPEMETDALVEPLVHVEAEVAVKRSDARLPTKRRLLLVLGVEPPVAMDVACV